MATTKERKIFTEPEFLTRNDVQNGRWTVDECRAIRGEPWTNITAREMRVPTQDDDLARCIRAHEMMHAKVSPDAVNMEKWADRKVASLDALKAVEEVRVNFLCQKAGFNVKENLADAGETADGERIAATKDWTGAVIGAVMTAGTSANKSFLTGVRRHNREWGVILLDISKRILKEIKKADKYGQLGSTMIDQKSGLFPLGFSHTERLAEWVDRISDKSPEQIAKEKEDARREREAKKLAKSSGGSSEEDSSEEDGDGGEGGESTRGTHSNVGANKRLGKGKDDGNPYKGLTPDGGGSNAIPHWGELNIEVMPMPVHTKGNIGKKRIASNVGMRPRRMHRLLTDPQMRVFDRTIKGHGGVVIIDGSGSMSFSREQLTRILENAPGATVAIYTDRGPGLTNMFVVAKKGKMVNELPNTGHGNGVDFPAIEWGIKQKQASNSPMVWVTDGGVCGPNQHYSRMLAMQCINFCKKNNIVVVPHVNEAIDQLKKLKAGEKAKSVWPPMFKDAYKKSNGGLLV